MAQATEYCGFDKLTLLNWSYSNSTDTALGLLTLTYLCKSFFFDLTMLHQSIDFLIRHQSIDGQWQGTNFIQMDTNRVSTLLGYGKASLIPRAISF